MPIRKTDLSRDSRVIELINSVRSGLMFLKFPGESEKAFRHYYYKRSIWQARIAFFLALFLYGVVGLIDQYVMPDVVAQIWMLRYLVVIPVILAALIVSFLIRREIVMQLAASVMVFVGASVVACMMCIDRGLGGYLYFSGFLLTIVYGYTFIRIRFGYAAVCGWATLIFYIITAYFIRQAPAPVMINNILFGIIANFIGMFVAYTIEVNMRSEYLNAITMNKANKQLHKMSLFDNLTKIPNRRLFDIRISFEFNKLKQTAQPLSLIIADIDHFKEYNDNYGHPAGDRCLTRIAEKLQQFAARAGDLAARYGGEEFAIILSNTSLPEARILAENIRQETKRMGIPNADSSTAPVVTLSLGVATIIPSRYNTFTDLIMSADEALYKAKNGGRDRVEVFEIKR